MAMLYIFSGLPGSGKTTLARCLASHVNAAYLRADTIEQGLRDLCGFAVAGEGYRLAYRLASDNLHLGINVVADSCNPIELTRMEWRETGMQAGCNTVDIEITCSDAAQHRARIESRDTDIPGLALPDWQAVLARDYNTWHTPRICIDTAGQDVASSFQHLLDALNDG